MMGVACLSQGSVGPFVPRGPTLTGIASELFHSLSC